MGEIPIPRECGGKLQHYNMPQLLVRRRLARYDGWGTVFGQVAAPHPAQRGSAHGERNPDAPRGSALGDLYRLGSEIVKVVEKAPVFGHSVTKKVPQQGAAHLGKRGINVQVLLFQRLRQ